MSCLTTVIRPGTLTYLRRNLQNWNASKRMIHSCLKPMTADTSCRPFALHCDHPSIIRHSLPSLTLTHVRCYAKDKGAKDKKGNKGGKPKTVLTDDDMITVINAQDMRDELEAITESLKETYIKTLSIRSGTGIEELLIDFDGREYPLKELATISRKSANSLIINLSSMPDALKPVMEAINNSGMNVTPQQEGMIIYLSLPRVTREHREILAKNAKTLFQKAKDELAKCMNKYVRQANDAKLLQNISSDLVNNTIDNIRWAEAKAVAQCEQHLNTKVKELLGE